MSGWQKFLPLGLPWLFFLLVFIYLAVFISMAPSLKLDGWLFYLTSSLSLSLSLFRSIYKYKVSSLSTPYP